MDNDDNSLIELGLTKFWNLESLGITTEKSSVLQNCCDTITFKDGRYQVKLPWKDEHGKLYNNFELSKNHLTSLLTKLWNQSNCQSQKFKDESTTYLIMLLFVQTNLLPK